MPDEHTEDGQIARAKRLRDQIERLKSGAPPATPNQPSLREQIEQREREAEEREKAAEREKS